MWYFTLQGTNSFCTDRSTITVHFNDFHQSENPKIFQMTTKKPIDHSIFQSTTNRPVMATSGVLTAG